MRWDFDGDGQPDPGETAPVVIKRPGDVASRVTLFVVDPVWGETDKDGKPKHLARVTRRVKLPVVEAPATPAAATAGGVP